MDRICDLHGHFLPGMDDGCKTAQESLQVLQSSYQQGIRRVFATPHYYPVEPVEEFLKRRAESVCQLETYIQSQPEAALPQICLGAEVAFRPGLAYEPRLDALCLGKSRYLLLEMPFSRWGKAEEREVRNLCVAGGVTPVIAHVERYLDLQDRNGLQRILEQDVLVQMNAEFLLQLYTRREARRLLQSGMIQLLGTDCHNNHNRAPNLGKALELMKKKGMDDVLDRIGHFSDEIFSEAIGE